MVTVRPVPGGFVTLHVYVRTLRARVLLQEMVLPGLEVTITGTPTALPSSRYSVVKHMAGSRRRGKHNLCEAKFGTNII
jgi:hypothetical protein